MFVRIHQRLREFRRSNGGLAAVEFAMIAPATIMLFGGIVMFSVWLTIYGALQQIACDAARVAISGLSTTQQTQYATQYINNAILAYNFIDPAQVAIVTNVTASTFQVSISYNASNSFFRSMSSSASSSPLIITRSAVVQLSGF